MADFRQTEDEAPGQDDPEPSTLERFIKTYMGTHPRASPIEAMGAYQQAQQGTPEALKARIWENLSKPICGMRVGAATDPRLWPSTAYSGELDQGLLASFPLLTAARRKEVALMPYWGGVEAALYLLDRECPRSWDLQSMSAFNTIVRCPATCPEIANSLEWAERQGEAHRPPQDWCNLWKEQGRSSNNMVRRFARVANQETAHHSDVGQDEIDDRKLEPREVSFVKFMLSFRELFPKIPDAWLVQLVPVQKAVQFLEGGPVDEGTMRTWLRKYYKKNNIDGSQWSGRPTKEATAQLRKELGAWVRPAKS
jgi:hypothetical protein